jgi:GNAT superfamily N-acetyltransferase
MVKVMSQLPILTTELAQRIETLVAPEIPTSKETRDPAAPTIARFGRTIASKARSGRPANKVFCFGHEDLKLLEAILAFYAVDDLEPSFYLAPMGFTHEVAAALTAAGFSQQNFKQAILYGLPQTAPPQLPSDVVIERVTAASLDVFAHTTAEGFEWPNQWRDAAIDDVRRSFRPEAYHFLARFQGKPAGVGSIGIREGVASLIDGAVVPESRRKGIHLALLHHRLNMAHTLGCTLALGGTVFGSSSFRNQQRAGLRIAYIENGWRKR